MSRTSNVGREVDPLLLAGLSYNMIRGQTGAAISTISYRAQKLGLGKGRKRLDWDGIRLLISGGATISECCEKFGVAETTLYAAIRKGNANKPKLRTLKYCTNCNVLLEGAHQRKFCSHACARELQVKRPPYNECPHCHKMLKAGWRRHVANCGSETPNTRSTYVIDWKRRLKKALVLAFGGKCRNCGYDRSIRSLTFHHLDPASKEFTISGSNKNNRARIFEEARKCTLLCMNCHGEVHDGSLVLQDDPGLKEIWILLGSAPGAVC